MIKNNNSSIVIIPRPVEAILNNPVTDTSTDMFDEYEPEVKKEDIASITEKLSTNYSYLFLEDVPDINYVNVYEKSKYEKLNTPVIAYTCGEIRYVYHRLKSMININEDLSIIRKINSEKYEELVPYELALIILNEYNIKGKSYTTQNLKKAIDFIKSNVYYKNIDLNTVKENIIDILRKVIDEKDLQEVLK